MKPKVTQVAPMETEKSSPQHKALDLFWSWELVYRICGLYFDWPCQAGRRTTLRGGRLLKIASSIHTVVLMLFSFVNCLRYGPSIISFSGLTTEMALILLFMIVYSSGVWYYTCHFWLMSRYSVKLAEDVARVFQLMNTDPKISNMRTIIVGYMTTAVVTCAVSTTPLYLHTFSPTDAEGEGLKSVRMFPAQPNTTLYLVVLYAYTYVNVFQYLGFFTLIAYIVFFCYVIGHAFGEVTDRLNRLAGELDGDKQTTLKARSLESHKICSDSGIQTTLLSPLDPARQGGLGIGNPGRHFLQEGTVSTTESLSGKSEELDLEVSNLGHPGSRDEHKDKRAREVTSANVKDTLTDHVISGNLSFIHSRFSSPQKVDTQKLLRLSSADPDLDTKSSSGGSLESQMEDLRHCHLHLIQCVQTADRLISTVVFTVYWEGILMACFSVYALIVGAFPQSEYFTLCLCLIAVASQVVGCTAPGVWLNTKAHEPQTALLQLDICRLSHKEYRSMHIFLSQVSREHIGITALGLMPVNRATYLTIVGTIITYAVVVLQFNSGCQVPTVTANITDT